MQPVTDGGNGLRKLKLIVQLLSYAVSKPASFNRLDIQTIIWFGIRKAFVLLSLTDHIVLALPTPSVP